MTVGTQMHQALASLESAAASIKAFALETQDKNAKAMFSQYAKQLDDMCQGLSSRCNYIEQQEPQYQVYNQAIDKATKQKN